MNLQLFRLGEPVFATEAMARGSDAMLVPAVEPLPARAPGVAMLVAVDASAPAAVACETAGGEESSFDDSLSIASVRGKRPAACPNSPAEEKLLDERVKAAARLAADGVLLDAPDTWYAAGPRDAGFCGACEAKLGDVLARGYADQFAPTSTLHALAEAADPQRAPFWREHAWMRLRGGVEHGARLTRRVRDEVRLLRNAETQVGARLLGASPAAIRLAQKIDFALIPAPTPAPDRSGVSRYELFGAALSQRPLIGLLDAETAARPALVSQAARIASACRAEVSLPASAPAESHGALAAHRRFWQEFRAQYRPLQPLADVLLLYSPECDHWTGGHHLGAVRAVAEALTRLGCQYRVVLEVPRTGTEPIVLADAGALPEDDAARLERRVREGAGVLLVGACSAADDEGRPVEGPFPALTAGLNRVGAGTVFVAELQATAAGAERRWEPLVGALDKGLESLLGRGRRAIGASKSSLILKMYLDPEKKLDVHVVGRQFDPATGAAEEIRGLTLHLAGSAVSGARTAHLFTAETPERRVSLSPFGMGVQATLPDFAGAAVLTVNR